MMYTPTKLERIEQMYEECKRKWVEPTVKNIIIYSLFSTGGTLGVYEEEVQEFLSINNK